MRELGFFPGRLYVTLDPPAYRWNFLLRRNDAQLFARVVYPKLRGPRKLDWHWNLGGMRGYTATLPLGSGYIILWDKVEATKFRLFYQEQREIIDIDYVTGHDWSKEDSFADYHR